MFLNIQNDADLIGLTETHIHEGTLEHLSIPGFQLKCYKNQKSKKEFEIEYCTGGIAVFVRENIAELFSIVDSDNENMVWVKIKKRGLGKVMTYM